jgi:hypothetical protein
MKWTLLLTLLLPWTGNAQDANARPLYYAGFNPIAPLAGIRPGFASGTLPAASNLETGASVFIGKIWNRHYNVETRVSYGSPSAQMRQFLVQSGLNYCFNRKYPERSLLNSAYAGLFVKLQTLRSTAVNSENTSVILYWSAGKRFVHKRFFADVRINQHIVGIKWTEEKDSEPVIGFHPSIYNWKSPYMPFAGIGLGYIISR